MSNTIPPLLCSTPPPIDFDDGGGENEPDDFEPFETSQGVYGQFEGPSEPNTPKHKNNLEKNKLDLPIPDFIPYPTKLPVDTAKKENIDQMKPNFDENHVKDDNDETIKINFEKTNSSDLEKDIHIESNDKSFTTKDSIGFIISEPPPIDIGYSSESQSPKNSRGDSPLSIEFSPGHLSDDDASIDFQINESRYDDNTSLPSLKFDAINISKSVTPISEDKSITEKSPVLNELQSVDKEENQSAFDSAISNQNIDPDKDSCVTDNDLLPENAEADFGLDNETMWNESTFGDLEPTEIISKGNSDETAQSVSVEENLTIENSKSETNDLNRTLLLDKEANVNSEHTSLDDYFADDFQAFEEFGGALKECNKNITDSGIEFNKDDIAFEVDFSQVDFPPIQPPFSEGIAGTDKSTMPSNPSKEIEENEDDFEDFQDFKVVPHSQPDSKIIKCDSYVNADEIKSSGGNDKAEEYNDNDDDFGDFGDFKEASASESSPVVEHSPAVDFAKIDLKLTNVLKMMFPVDEPPNGNEKEENVVSPGSLGKNLALDLEEIDSAKALEYQWLHSNIKNSLVKSLGIDSRNILYGEKWNSSMPRFAANLGFGPLEPLKPTKLPSDSSTMLQPLKASSSVSTEKSSISNNGSSDVPAVKFDWNTSGLVNPLDGVKEILHEGKTETIHPTKSNDSDGSNGVATTDQNPTATNQTNISFIASLSSIDNDLKEPNDIEDNVISNTNHINFRPDDNYMKPLTITTSKLIPLKETHIFTPSKSECTISRSVTKASEKVPIDFDYEIAAAGIVINEQVVNKEYRDVVYNPDAQIRTSETLVADVSHDESRYKKDQINPMVDPNKNFRQKSLAPDLLSGSILSIMEKKLEPTFEAQSSLEDEFSDFQQNNLSPTNQTTTNQASGTLLPVSSTEIAEKSSFHDDFIQNESKDENMDDEFTDFQSVAPSVGASQQKAMLDVKSKSRTETPGLSDEMILSPAVLLPQAVKLTSSEPKINWPGNSDIDPEELARLEQLFPQAKQVVTQSFVQNVPETSSTGISSPKKDQKDDDDWSDFVSVSPSFNSGNQNQQEPIAAPTATKLSTISKTYDDDDWCDFVSSTSTPVQTVAKPWSISHLPPPQFSSWNQPSSINSLPSHGGYGPSASKTSHMHMPPQNINYSSVPTIPSKSVHQPYVYANNNQFLVNGHYNQHGVHSRPHAQYQQQHNMYSSQQRLSQQQHQFQKQQRTSMNSNTNINVLKSQLNLAPSISLIPDLSFSAPKPLVNLSRTNTSSKK